MQPWILIGVFAEVDEHLAIEQSQDLKVLAQFTLKVAVGSLAHRDGRPIF